MKRLLLITLCFISFNTFAGGYFYKAYTWQKEPSKPESFTNQEGHSAKILKDMRIIELNSPERVQYETYHKIIHLYTDRGIEEFNTAYVPLYGAKIIEINARSISPDGKVTVLPEDKIMSKENLKGYGAFRMFAFEGLTKGSVIEYFYSIEKPLLLGGSESFQSHIETQNAHFELIADEIATADAKGYNGISKIEKSVKDGKTHFVSKTASIPPYVDEKYSSEGANKMRIDYKLMNITEGSDTDELNSWRSISYRNFGQIFSKDADKEIKKIIKKKIKLTGKSEEEIIKAIEVYIKKTYSIKKGGNDELEKLESILENKYANETGINKLFASFFRNAGINFWYILTTNRFKVKMDPDFPSTNHLDSRLFYFPKYDKYIAPDIAYLRYGYIPRWYGDNYGLIIRIGFVGLEYETKYLEYPDITNNKVVTDVSVNFSEDLSKIKVNKTHQSNGYRGFNNRANYFYTQKKEDYVREMIVYGAIDDLKLENFSVENEDIEKNGEPSSMFTVKTNLSMSSLMEWAGKDHLFNVGMIIGTQAEIYQDHERTNPIEMTHPIEYLHSIKVVIPEGYEVKGLDDILIDKYVLDKDSNRILQFKSTYTLKDNILDIQIQEFYKEMILDKSKYDVFREVINAAADFNKVTIVLVEK